MIPSNFFDALPVKVGYDNIPNYVLFPDTEILYHGKHVNDVIPRYIGNDGNVYLELKNASGVPFMARLDKIVISSNNRYYDDIVCLVHNDKDLFNCHNENLSVIRSIDINPSNENLYSKEILDEIPEIWKEVPTDKRILISNFGNVRYINVDRIPNIMDNHGYKWIQFFGNKYFVHRLVAEAFIDNPNPAIYKYVNHKDCVKWHNNFMNLEWVNTSMNTKHAYEHGLLSVTYEDSLIHKVCALLEKGLPHTEIEKITGVNRKYISEIYVGRKRKDISKNYNFQHKQSRDEKYHRNEVLALIDKGVMPKEIAKIIKVEYNQPFISYYEMLKREIRKSKNK